MKYHIYKYIKKTHKQLYLTKSEDGIIYWGAFYSLAMLFDSEDEAKQFWHSKDFKFKNTRSQHQGVEKHN